MINFVDSTSGIDTGHFQFPYCYQLFFRGCLVLERLGDGAVKVVAIGKFCTY